MICTPASSPPPYVSKFDYSNRLTSRTPFGGAAQNTTGKLCQRDCGFLFSGAVSIYCPQPPPPAPPTTLLLLLLLMMMTVILLLLLAITADGTGGGGGGGLMMVI